jgi:hypothetical protein
MILYYRQIIDEINVPENHGKPCILLQEPGVPLDFPSNPVSGRLPQSRSVKRLMASDQIQERRML